MGMDNQSILHCIFRVAFKMGDDAVVTSHHLGGQR